MGWKGDTHTHPTKVRLYYFVRVELHKTKNTMIILRNLNKEATCIAGLGGVNSRVQTFPLTCSQNIILKLGSYIHSLNGVVEGIVVARHASKQQTSIVVKLLLI